MFKRITWWLTVASLAFLSCVGSKEIGQAHNELDFMVRILGGLMQKRYHIIWFDHAVNRGAAYTQAMRLFSFLFFLSVIIFR